jgi:hypothetical protein
MVISYYYHRFFLTILLIALSSVDTLPTGFADEGVGNGSEQAISGIFVPNPRQNGKPMLIIATKDGPIYVFEDPDNSNIRIQIANMANQLCTNGPRGILNIKPHPKFATNQYIFMWYSSYVPNCPEDEVLGPTNRLSRFTLDANTLQLDLTSEKIFLQTSPSKFAIHDGGAFTIGNDNLIYLAIGDGGSLRQGQDLNTLYGKMIRLDLDGNVPGTNPFTIANGQQGVACRKNNGIVPPNATIGSICEEIYAYGFRNPYRLGVDINKVNIVRFAIGDVGSAIWEEISYGGTGFKGRNYGWRTMEGPCERNSNTVCPIPTKDMVDPFYYYQHSKNGGAVTGVVFVPKNILWPTKYKILFLEYVEGKIINLIADSTVGCRTCIPPKPAFRNETFHENDRILDVFFGPYNNTQAMYYISRITLGDNIRRIRFVGGTDNPPTAIITLDRKVYKVNETINFIGSNSTEIDDGDSLTYSWTFGDGRTSTEENPIISYSNQGSYQIELTVTDTSGLFSKVFDTIIIGLPPIPAMVSPSKGSQFFVGENIRILGSAKDSFGTSLNTSQLFWEVRLRHGGHYHPFLPVRSGNNFDLFAAPQPEDVMAATNSYLVFILTAVDSNGLSTTLKRSINPRKVLIDIDSTPSGLNILVGGFNVVTPATITAWERQTLELEVVDQRSIVFHSWNIGGPRQQTYLVPPTNTTRPKIIARFV